jgi:hypothetical protein
LKPCYVPTSGDYLPVAATAAARFLAGEVGSQDINVDTLMWELLNLAAASGAGIADETLASAALSEARVEIPPAKFDKDGFAPGIERVPERDWGLEIAQLNARIFKSLSRKRLPSIGVLKEG